MNSLIIFLLHYNLQHLPFDFYYHLMGGSHRFVIASDQVPS